MFLLSINISIELFLYKNESTDIETFENSIFCNAFAHFQELHKKYNEKKKWINYSKSFKTRRGTFTIIKYN